MFFKANTCIVLRMMQDDGAVTLGAPPSFGAGGAWPPLESRPVVIASAMFATAPRSGRASGEYRTTLTRWSIFSPTTKVVTATLGGVLFWPAGVVMLGYVAIKKMMRTGKSGEVRQVVYSQVWRRDDPVVQLPPGVTHEQSYSMTCGISETQTRELAQSLGLKLGRAGALTGELSSKFGIATTISEQQSLTHTVTLRNDGAQAYRLYARWFVRHEITVQRLELPDGPAWQGTGQDWQDVLNGTAGSYRRSPLYKVSFMSPQTAVLTFCEVGK
jgi:hypothetical protein